MDSNSCMVRDERGRRRQEVRGLVLGGEEGSLIGM